MDQICERYICPACGGTGNTPTCQRENCGAVIVVERPAPERVKETGP